MLVVHPVSRMASEKTIGISNRTWQRLGSRRQAGETYDDVITRLLEQTEPEVVA